MSAEGVDPNGTPGPVDDGGDNGGGDDREGTSARRRLVRAVRLHGAVDLLFAGGYAWLGFAVAPSRAPVWNVFLVAAVALLAVAGAALTVGWKKGRVLAIVAQLVLLVGGAVMLVLLVASAAYLRGIYGPLGAGMAWLAVVAAALIVELCGLLPYVQLRFLLRADVRRHFLGPR